VAWNWREVPNALGVTDHLAWRATTCGELDDAFKAAAAHRDRMVLIEAVVPQLDVPPLLAEVAEAAAAANASRIAAVSKPQS
jgi:alpha-keto-acid decarboxylase